jgi:ribosomal protein S18 acetylase RimI-like enzyme
VVGINIEYRHVKEWDIDQIIALYKAGSWWKDDYERSGIEPLIKGSFDFVIAFDVEERKAVGMGRMISDGVSDGYIQDVVVLHDLRGRGIGSNIIKELLRNGKEKGLVWMGLIAEKDSRRFYEPLGFKEFKGTPMLFEEDQH